MSAARWSAYIVITLLTLAAVSYLYRRREPAGRGRNLLTALRWCALAILFLLLFDPRLRQPTDLAAARRAPVLLDGSFSMLLPDASGAARWRDAVAQATKRAGSGGVTLFGDAPHAVATDSIARVTPYAMHSRLLPALQSAAEAGATSITIVTDGDIEDGDAVERWVPRLGVAIDWVTTRDAARDIALTGISAPSWGEAGKPLDIDLDVQTIDGASPAGGASPAPSVRDSATITLRQDGAVIGVTRIALPSTNRVTTARVTVRPRAPAGGGYVRIEATIDAGDGFKDDNVRNAYVYVSADPAGIVLVSLAPDWEPRFLLPVLERAVALPARGYLRAGSNAWVRVGVGLDAGKRATDADVQRAVANADLVIVHNAARDEPAWINSALHSAPRVIVIPGANAAGLDLPVRLTAPTADDWFASADVPASPVAPLLSGVKVEDAPPLESVIAVDLPPGAWAPLLATRGRRGMPAPLAAAGETGSQRWAVDLGAGYWRWAFQGGAAADVYNRMWASLGGWIMRDTRSADIAAVRPVQRAVLRGESVRWVSRNGAIDSIRVKVTPVAGGAPRETMMTADRDTAVLKDVAPGTYHFDATAFTHRSTASATGELTVETYSPEFARSRATLTTGKAGVSALRAQSRETRPLHASWVPYALLLLLLATEWILRRRWGLR